MGIEPKIDRPLRSLRERRRSQVQVVAAGELADIVAVLRDRACEFNMGFLAYILDMATKEALSIKNGGPVRPEPIGSIQTPPQ